MKRTLALLSLFTLLAATGCPKKNVSVPPPPTMPQPPEAGEELKASLTFAPCPQGARVELAPLHLETHPGDQPPRPWKCESLVGESFADAGDRLLENNRPGEAITCFDEAVSRGQAGDRLPEVRFKLGMSYALAGLPTNADKEFRELARQGGEYARRAQVIVAIVDRMNQRSKDEVRRLENALKKLIDATGRPPR